MRMVEIVPSALMWRQNHLVSNAAARFGNEYNKVPGETSSPKQQSAVTFGD